MPYREIARQLSVAEGTVRNRVAQLTESGWMRILAITDPIRLGVPILATTYARVKPDSISAFADRVAASPNVRYLAKGLGHANVVAESLHRDVQDLYAFTQTYLHVPEVMHYETMQVVDIQKSVWDWDLSQLQQGRTPTEGVTP